MQQVKRRVVVLSRDQSLSKIVVKEEYSVYYSIWSIPKNATKKPKAKLEQL
jgi:hypothetical protein